MNASSFRNGCKSSGYSIYQTFIYRQSTTSEFIRAVTPITRRESFHQTRAFFKSSNSSVLKKAKDLEGLSPMNLINSSKTGSTLVSWYLGMVKTRPVLTKSVTSALIYAAADLTSQTLISTETYDVVRTLRMGVYGLLILGPTLHYWFNFMSRILPKRDMITTFKKMFLGQAVYGPCMTVVFFSTNAALQGESRGEIISRLKRDVVPTMLSGIMYWPFCDFLTFKFFPVHLQPLVSNSFSYLWTIYLTYMASLEKTATVA
ncbi:PXMP2/4 family protein 4-like [Impatiens glandulifera]|uniref:PXMP2/4 family protein 4-like n=1 Tax=Impatiens glandulifera TaxID=253017 RepID=UPI001FB19400|nr:PXMP2/4 family protein 4-like [Impatiens glandulifera]